jgi:hypothetical protein
MREESPPGVAVLILRGIRRTTNRSTHPVAYEPGATALRNLDDLLRGPDVEAIDVTPAWHRNASHVRAKLISLP